MSDRHAGRSLIEAFVCLLCSCPPAPYYSWRCEGVSFDRFDSWFLDGSAHIYTRLFQLISNELLFHPYVKISKVHFSELMVSISALISLEKLFV